MADQHSVIKGLLGRGGSSLLTATIARSRGIEMGTHRWQALSPDLIASVEQVLGCLSQSMPVDWLEMTIRRTLIGEEVAAVPEWLTPVYRSPEALSFVGGAVTREEVSCALGIRAHHPSERYLGLAAVAVALSRMQDTLDTLSRRLNHEDGNLIVRMGRLAGVTIQSGEPTRMRRRVRLLLREHVNG